MVRNLIEIDLCEVSSFTEIVTDTRISLYFIEICCIG
jgi:hypothetical protein